MSDLLAGTPDEVPAAPEATPDPLPPVADVEPVTPPAEPVAPLESPAPPARPYAPQAGDRVTASVGGEASPGTVYCAPTDGMAWVWLDTGALARVAVADVVPA